MSDDKTQLQINCDEQHPLFTKIDRELHDKFHPSHFEFTNFIRPLVGAINTASSTNQTLNNEDIRKIVLEGIEQRINDKLSVEFHIGPNEKRTVYSLFSQYLNAVELQSSDIVKPDVQKAFKKVSKKCFNYTSMGLQYVNFFAKNIMGLNTIDIQFNNEPLMNSIMEHNSPMLIVNSNIGTPYDYLNTKHDNPYYQNQCDWVSLINPSENAIDDFEGDTLLEKHQNRNNVLLHLYESNSPVIEVFRALNLNMETIASIEAYQNWLNEYPSHKKELTDLYNEMIERPDALQYDKFGSFVRLKHVDCLQAQIMQSLIACKNIEDYAVELFQKNATQLFSNDLINIVTLQKSFENSDIWTNVIPEEWNEYGLGMVNVVACVCKSSNSYDPPPVFVREYYGSQNINLTDMVFVELTDDEAMRCSTFVNLTYIKNTIPKIEFGVDRVQLNEILDNNISSAFAHNHIKNKL